MEQKTVPRDDGTCPARHIGSADAENAPLAGNALLAGTIVLTLEGALPVEYLSPGDRIITRDSGMAVLGSIRRNRQRTRLVAVSAQSFGKGHPEGDILLPARHEILVRDWRAQALFGVSRALVPVDRLADGEHVRLVGTRDVDLVELGFDAPHILYAGGLELASGQGADATA